MMEIAVNTAQEISQISPQRLEDLINRFISDQDVKESSKGLYRRTLKQFFTWVRNNSYSFSAITRAEVLKYKEDLLSSEMSSLTKRKQQFKKQPLLPAQASALLDFYRDKALRDYAIVSLLLRTGLRTVEAIRANVGDIVFKGSQRVLLVHGKGRDEKDNFVLLTDKAYQPLKAYLDTREKTTLGEPLFTSTSNNSKGERLTTRSISFIAKEGLKAIGLDERSFTAHSLRHTTAVNILRSGGSLEMAQFTLRHSNPATTQIYTASLNEERRLQNSGEALIDNLY
jgi:integrase/recombinase XerD